MKCCPGFVLSGNPAGRPLPPGHVVEDPLYSWWCGTRCHPGMTTFRPIYKIWPDGSIRRSKSAGLPQVDDEIQFRKGAKGSTTIHLPICPRSATWGVEQGLAPRRPEWYWKVWSVRAVYHVTNEEIGIWQKGGMCGRFMAMYETDMSEVCDSVLSELEDISGVRCHTLVCFYDIGTWPCQQRMRINYTRVPGDTRSSIPIHVLFGQDFMPCLRLVITG